MSTQALTLDQLRAHLSRVAPMRTGAPVVSTGLPRLDAVLGGWPRPGIVSIHGAIGTGRLGSILPIMRSLTHRDHTVAIVDPTGWLHPPGLPGVNLQKLMIVRCGSERASWAASQLAASGAIPITVLLDPPPLRTSAHRLMHATEAGKSTLFVLTEQRDPHLTTPIRMRTIGNGKIEIERGAPHQPVITL